jgi:NAD(P)-dependent dehydrogenase (short-subunit alcohol dehydrogenase family)
MTVGSSGVLEGKIALITGAAMGMGRDSALCFAQAGASVVVVDIAEEQGRETVQLIERAGGTAAFVAADVTVETDVAGAVAFAVDRFGHLDCAHNNAGGDIAPRSITEYSEAEWDLVVDLNVKGTFFCIKHELRHMLDHGGGSIVTTASASAYRGSVASAAYTASKHAVAGLTRKVAVEVATRGVRVNAVCPGVTLTDGLLRGIGGHQPAAHLAREMMPMETLIPGPQIGQAAVWLCSDAAGWVTGVVLPVDGGMSAL